MARNKLTHWADTVWKNARIVMRPARWTDLARNAKDRYIQSRTHQWIAGSKQRIALVAGGFLLIGAAAYTGINYVQNNTIELYKVYMNGTEIGSVSDPQAIDTLIALKTKEMQEKYPEANVQLQTEGLTYEAYKKFQGEADDETTLSQLGSMFTVYAAGVELKVDGKTIGIVKDQETADQILAEVKKQYTSGEAKPIGRVRTLSSGAANHSQTKEMVRVEKAAFEEEVHTDAVQTAPDQVINAEEALRLLTTGDAKPVKYKVEPGDTVSGIAHKFDISKQVIYENNPDIEELYLQIGQELDLTVIQPALTVSTVEKVTENVVIEPDTVVQNDPNMKAGEKKVIRPGKSGLKQMSYRLTKKNGLLVSEEWLGQQVITPSVAEIIVKGTKVVGEGSGSFRWPVSGARLTSSYGKRWGRMHNGVDLVSSNKTIMASDSGVVSFAGKKSGFGNAIIIDHKNGYETLYGHLSKISVKKGDKVEKGEKIGVMGNTGRSTGTHLHFEVHKNGSIQNPMKYLK